MSKPTPLNKAAAEKQLLDEYKKVSGEEPDEAVEMVCKMSAGRAMKEKWKWIRKESSNFPMSLVWG